MLLAMSTLVEAFTLEAFSLSPDPPKRELSELPMPL
jgi:hypothetical protein